MIINDDHIGKIFYYFDKDNLELSDLEYLEDYNELIDELICCKYNEKDDSFNQFFFNTYKPDLVLKYAKKEFAHITKLYLYNGDIVENIYLNEKSAIANAKKVVIEYLKNLSEKIKAIQ